MSQTKTIKPFEAFGGLPDVDVVTRGTAVVTKMTGNSNFQTPAVDLVGLKADIDALSVLMAESLDGSKKVIAEKKKARSFGAGVDGQLERVRRCLGCYSGGYC